MLMNGIKRVKQTTLRSFKSIYRKYYSENPYFYEYKFDNIATKSNMNFVNELNFVRCHKKSIEYGGRDYCIYLRVHQALWCASVAQKIEGDFVELGTGRGYIFAAVSEALKINGIEKAVYLFDTFRPYKTDPVTGAQEDSQAISKVYADSYEKVKEKFLEYKDVRVVKGKCPEILSSVYSGDKKRISFLHVDLNYYEAEYSSLQYLWPYLSPGAIILLDDYSNPGRERQYSTHNKFFEEHQASVLTLASGQGLVIKPFLT